MISEHLVDRLVCAKYIFESGADVLDRGTPYAAGVAVLAFQDAAEMVLRVIAEHLHAQIKENTAFNQILDEIDKVSPGKLTHRTALNQLNKARVNFKHLALAPRDEDVVKFRRDLDGFFASATNAYLGLDFSSLSLSSLISHRRTRNWLQRAEKAFEAEQYRGCLECCAASAHIFQSYQEHSSARDRRGIDLRVSSDSMDVLRLARDVSNGLQDRLSDIQDQIDMIGAGISYADFRRFQDLTPRVSIYGNGRLEFQWRNSSPANADSALFCIGFVRTMILKQQGQYKRPNLFAGRGGQQRYVTIAVAPVIVHPRDKVEDIEVIEELGIGVELTAYGNARYDLPGHVAILYQSDCAYISIESVRALNES